MNNSNHSTNWQQCKDGSNNYDSQDFGDELSNSKSKEVIRILFQNVRGFGYHKDQQKTTSIKKLALDSQADIFCMSEINIHWNSRSRQHSIRQVAKNWYENSKTSTAQNMHYKGKTKHQPGRVSIISQGNLSQQTYLY